MKNLEDFKSIELKEWEVLLISGGHQGTSYNAGYALGQTLGFFSNVMEKVNQFADYLKR